MAPFRIVLAAGAAIVTVLALLGMFPAAMAAAAVLVPSVMVLYLLDVDLYEDEPLVTVVATMLWGAIAGVGLGFVAKEMAPSGVELLLSSGPSRVLTLGVVLPLAGLVLALVGPLVLLRHPKFNDVLDGVTFGAASAVCLAGAQAIVQGSDLFAEGLRPVGAVGPWVFRTFSQGVLIPVLWACAVGAVGAALWLRYRAPVRDRTALGALGKPALAALAGGALLVAASVLVLELEPAWTFVSLLPLDLIGVVLLRRAIHLGLLEESLEIPIGPEVTCPNCGHPTPRHTFCIACGIALAAMPKRPARRERPEPDPGPGAEHGIEPTGEGA
jgi:hypothetical protein